MEKKNVLSSFMNKLMALPMWIKEVIFIQLRDELENNSINAARETFYKEDLYQYYLPTLTYSGKKELAARATGHADNLYKFLEGVADGFNIIEITLNNYWTLEETAKLNLESLELEYISPSKSNYVRATGTYLSGKIRLGEFFKRIGRIDVDQLDTAIRKQKEYDKNGKKIGMAKILIDLGYITENDANVVLFIKDECKKRFIFNTDILGKSVVSASNQPQPQQLSTSAFAVKIDKLTRENEFLTAKLNAISDIVQK